MPRLDVFDEEFGQDPVAILRVRRRRIVRRFWTLAAAALGLGVIAALVFAWSTADGRLRLELQSAASVPRAATREASNEELDRLRREVDALRTEISELAQAQQQAQQRAADTIAALQAAEEEARSQAPAPAYWYSNPAALNPAIASQPQPSEVALPPRRPATGRRELRDVPRGRPAPVPPQAPQQ